MGNIIQAYRADQQTGEAYRQYIIQRPNPKWVVDLFGNNAIVFELDLNVSRWRRFWAKFFLGSRWKKL